MLDELTIQKAAQSGPAYVKGCQYHRGGRVKMLRRSAQPHTFQATVSGTELYTTVIHFNDLLKLTGFACDCPAFISYYDGGCKHVIAVLKQLQKDWSTWFTVAKAPILTRAAKDMLQFFQQAAHEGTTVAPRHLVQLVPTYEATITPHHKLHALGFVIGTDRLYVVRDISLLINAVVNKQELVYGKSFTWQPEKMAFDATSEQLFALLKEAHEEERQRQGWSHSYLSNSHSIFGDTRKFRLTNTKLLRFLTIMDGKPFSATINGHDFKQVPIIHSRPPVAVDIRAVEGGLKMALVLDRDVLLGLDTDYHYLFHDETIFRVDDHFSRYIKPLIQSVRDSKKLETILPETVVSEFVTTALPLLETIAHVQVEPTVYDRFHKEPLEAAVYLDRLGEGMSARVEFRYGPVTINPLATISPEHPGLEGKWLLRQTREEKKVLDLFYYHGFSDSGEMLLQPDEDHTYAFLQQALAELRDIAEVYYADNFPIHIKPASKVSAAVRLNNNNNLLEFSLSHDDTSPQELLALLDSYKLKKHYHRLKDGSFISLDNPEFQTAASLIEQLGLRPADLAKSVIELPKYRALYLDSLSREAPDFSIEKSSAFKKMVQDIREPQDVEYTLPSGIQGQLRNYQKTGFKWLKSLANYGLGGILADDMGLGKTLQVLTFVLSEKQANPLPSLVIAPTSLVYNWQEEVAKFTPSLKVAVISGQQSDRLEQLKSIDEADLVVTSYGLLRRDIDLYEERKFKYCFLDEAQHIKNPQTISAQSVKRIKANSYFALTGTPIENNLTELWSIFDFIMPGYLRSHGVFTKRFEIPIVKNGDQQALTELGRHIKPFLLRRMKKAVLKELPPKTESKMLCDMTTEQTKLYQAWLLQARTEFENEVALHGFDKSQIKILALLTRLRQLCCHPALFLENYDGGSGKLELLQEIVKDAVDGGHRILLFSQFTGMLALIRRHLEEAGLSYYYLDGATKSEDRLKLVNSFNSGATNIFLISLKAGGTGLNLTGADMVIHYDPWWNPAVEEQATDRAYRIGQKNPVQVYKLITKGTIEEKIYQLQQQKRELVDSLIQPGENFLTRMKESEIRELFM